MSKLHLEWFWYKLKLQTIHDSFETLNPDSWAVYLVLEQRLSSAPHWSLRYQIQAGIWGEIKVRPRNWGLWQETGFSKAGFRVEQLIASYPIQMNTLQTLDTFLSSFSPWSWAPKTMSHMYPSQIVIEWLHGSWRGPSGRDVLLK